MFDTALIESAHPVDDARRARSLPLAIGFHAAVIAALILSALWSTGEVPEPAFPTSFPVFLAAPPPPKGDGGTTPRRPDRPAAAERRIEVPLARIPDVPLAAEDEAASAHPVPFSEFGPVNGSAGDPAGKEGGSGTDPVNVGLGDEILTPGLSGVLPPVLIHRVEPEYPETARRLHMEGVVILKAVITGSGAVDEVRIAKSAGPLLDAAASAAVRRWLYQPATRYGRPVVVYLDVVVTFNLKGTRG